MSLCIAWVRTYNNSTELCMIADSCFTGGQNFLAAPKLFCFQRGDCALACAGNTAYSFPIIEHLMRSIEINQKLRDRAADITQLRHNLIDITNKCLQEEHDIQYEEGGPDFSLILAGYSWKKKEPCIYIIRYDKKTKKMRYDTPRTVFGNKCAFIGDHTNEAFRMLSDMLFDRDNPHAKVKIDMEPLDVLLSFINNKEIPYIGGYPQMLKIYPYLRTLPIGFLISNGNEKNIYYGGRPLLKYETFPYPIYNIENREYVYMKKTADEFLRAHEEIKPLSMFKN